jgi:large subunit ribosomal protein L22
MKSYLKNYRQSPRKVRLAADLVRGKKVSRAIQDLTFATKRTSDPLIKLIKSAVANAKNNFNANEDNLIIKEIQVNKGIVLKRLMPRARGSASRINKRTSHISITLEEKTENKKSKK